MTRVTNRYQYDSLNRLTNLVWNYHNSRLASYAYQLMAGGTRTYLLESTNGAPAIAYEWSFDNLYRLTNENIGTFGNVAYGYDPVGNRTSQNSTISGVASDSYTYDTNDELVADGSGTNNPYYNGDGDMISWGNYGWVAGSGDCYALFCCRKNGRIGIAWFSGYFPRWHCKLLPNNRVGIVRATSGGFFHTEVVRRSFRAAVHIGVVRMPF